MLKLLHKKPIVSFCLIACCLLMSSCFWLTHKPGKPGTMSIDKTFSRHKTLENQSLYLTFAESKGIFSKRTLEDFVYQFSSKNTFNYYQAAGHVLVATGTYKYILSTKTVRLAFIKFYNQTGTFGKSTFNIQLNFYSPDMGTYKISLKSSPKRNYASGIFKIKPTIRR